MMGYSTETSSFINSRGQRLRYRLFKPDGEIKAVLAFHPGYREHLDRKNGSLSLIAGAGYLAFVMEAHGHGLSEPLGPEYMRFTTDDMFYYVDDFSQFIKEIIGKNQLVIQKDLDVFIGGVSMGGEVATLTALQEQSRFKGLVLGCPAIDVERNWIISLQEYLAEILTKLIPYQRIVPALAIEEVTNEPEVSQILLSDDLMQLGNVAIKQAYEMVRGFNYIAAHEHELTLPILVTIGTEDKAVSLKAICRLLKNSSSEDVTLDFIKGACHAMDYGKDLNKCCNSLINWLNKRYN
eukprot:TRINITY_DN1139_c0_g5_i1.p1 TRINITY_DN1139_c0_g5~~TRINITY_DN1139_c0_g5_i1.p1  ORF type:complete len:294 (-),score=35.53 TRINITY_DN1139_c0_g5_i1:537-1418(-)